MTSSGTAFHDGELAAQRCAGTGDRAERVRRAMVTAGIPPEAYAFLAEQRLLIVGARDEGGRPWATNLQGPEGFLGVPDEGTLRVSARVGDVDPLSDALQHEVEVGTLVIDLVDRVRLRINGRWRPTAQGGEIEVHQAFGNCPKYIQARAGGVQQGGAVPVSTRAPSLDARARELVAGADTFFIATAAGGVDVSHRGGNPGFVSVDSATELSWPDFVGNAMMMTAGNLEVDPRAGLLFPDWVTGSTLQVTGSARVSWSGQGPGDSPANGHRTVFRVEEVRWIENGFPTGWTAPEYSRHNA